MLFLACWFGLLVWVGACVVRLFAVVCVVDLLFYCFDCGSSRVRGRLELVWLVGIICG